MIFWNLQSIENNILKSTNHKQVANELHMRHDFCNCYTIFLDFRLSDATIDLQIITSCKPITNVWCNPKLVALCSHKIPHLDKEIESMMLML